MAQRDQRQRTQRTVTTNIESDVLRTAEPRRAGAAVAEPVIAVQQRASPVSAHLHLVGHRVTRLGDVQARFYRLHLAVELLVRDAVRGAAVTLTLVVDLCDLHFEPAEAAMLVPGFAPGDDLVGAASDEAIGEPSAAMGQPQAAARATSRIAAVRWC